MSSRGYRRRPVRVKLLEKDRGYGAIGEGGMLVEKQLDISLGFDAEQVMSFHSLVHIFMYS